MPTSPAPSDDESGSHSRPAGFPGATSLKYTTTIMGPSRTGALGLRTNGKRSSVQDASRLSLRRSASLPRKPNGRTDQDQVDSTPTLPASASPRTNIVSETIAENDAGGSDGVDANPAAGTASSAPQLNAPQLNAPQVNIPVAFVPRFKGAAEMEARRRLRMAHRNQTTPGVPAVLRPQVSAPATLNPERSLSSSSSSASSSDMEERGVLADEDDEDEFDDDVADDLDDEFDP